MWHRLLKLLPACSVFHTSTSCIILHVHYNISTSSAGRDTSSPPRSLSHTSRTTTRVAVRAAPVVTHKGTATLAVTHTAYHDCNAPQALSETANALVPFAFSREVEEVEVGPSGSCVSAQLLFNCAPHNHRDYKQ